MASFMYFTRGVGFGGRGNIAALDIANYDKALLSGVCDRSQVCVESVKPVALVHGDLRLDGGNDIRDSVNNRAIKGEKAFHGQIYFSSIFSTTTFSSETSTATYSSS